MFFFLRVKFIKFIVVSLLLVLGTIRKIKVDLVQRYLVTNQSRTSLLLLNTSNSCNRQNKLVPKLRYANSVLLLSVPLLECARSPSPVQTDSLLLKQRYLYLKVVLKRKHVPNQQRHNHLSNIIKLASKS